MGLVIAILLLALVVLLVGVMLVRTIRRRDWMEHGREHHVRLVDGTNVTASWCDVGSRGGTEITSIRQALESSARSQLRIANSVERIAFKMYPRHLSADVVRMYEEDESGGAAVEVRPVHQSGGRTMDLLLSHSTTNKKRVRVKITGPFVDEDDQPFNNPDGTPFTPATISWSSNNPQTSDIVDTLDAGKEMLFDTKLNGTATLVGSFAGPGGEPSTIQIALAVGNSALKTAGVDITDEDEPPPATG